MEWSWSVWHNTDDIQPKNKKKKTTINIYDKKMNTKKRDNNNHNSQSDQYQVASHNQSARPGRKAPESSNSVNIIWTPHRSLLWIDWTTSTGKKGHRALALIPCSPSLIPRLERAKPKSCYSVCWFARRRTAVWPKSFALLTNSSSSSSLMTSFWLLGHPVTLSRLDQPVRHRNRVE